MQRVKSKGIDVEQGLSALPRKQPLQVAQPIIKIGTDIMVGDAWMRVRRHRTKCRFRMLPQDPMRGVYVGAIVEIHNFINNLADEGIAVVVITSYLPEILALSDHILAARAGKVVEEMSAQTAKEKNIMYAAVH